MITLRLTPAQAKILFNIVDGAADAGACVGGMTAQERRASASIMDKLLKCHGQWKDAKVQQG